MSKRDTWSNQTTNPHYPRRADIESAQYLALVARRYTQERACRREVDEAIASWMQSSPRATQSPESPEKVAHGLHGATGREQVK